MFPNVPYNVHPNSSTRRFVNPIRSTQLVS